MEKVIGLITCNYSAKETSPLTENRPVASLPYFGRYRMVDFALSNLVNCGIRTVGMVMPYNYRSIIDHVGSGKGPQERRPVHPARLRLRHLPHRRPLPAARPYPQQGLLHPQHLQRRDLLDRQLCLQR